MTHRRKIIEYLQEHGPSIFSNIPVPNPYRQTGERIRSLKLRTGSGMRRTSTVYYLDEHSYLSVIRCWLEQNEEVITQTPRSRLSHHFRDLGPDWFAAWEEVSDEYQFASHQSAPEEAGKQYDKQCPKCGSEVSARGYPAHLKRCSGK